MIGVIISVYAFLGGCNYRVGAGTKKGSITISLDSSSPASYTAPVNATNINFGTFKFTATNEDAEISEITLTREGLGLPSDFEGVKLIIDDIQISSTRTINPTSNTVTFSLSESLFIPAGQSITITVRADMYAAENSVNKICINSSEDVVAYGVTSETKLELQGNIPVCGNEVVTNTYSQYLLWFKEDFFTTDVPVGKTDVSMVQISFLNKSSNDAFAEKLTFDVLTWSMNYENVKLYKDDVVIGDSSNMIQDNQFVTFDLSQNPLLIPANGSVTVEFRMDLIGGLCQHLGVRLHHTESKIVDYHSQEMILVYDSETQEYTERLVVGTAIQYSSHLPSPSSTEVVQGADDHIFIEVGFNVGVDAYIDEFQVNAITSTGTETSFTDVKVFAKNSDEEWTVVSGPLNPHAATCTEGMCTYTFFEPIFARQCENTVLRITMDVDSSTPVGTTAFLQYLPPTTQASIAASGDPILSEDIWGNNNLDGYVQTVVAP